MKLLVFFLQCRCISLGGLRLGGGSGGIPFATNCKRKCRFRGFGKSENGLYFSSPIFSFSATVLHSLCFDPRSSILITPCRM